jgi:hypothetical protein
LAEEIDQHLGIRRAPPTYLLAADTLTLTFSGTPGTLVSLDAYTHEQRWISVSRLALPSVSGSGTLRLVNWPDDEFVVTLNVQPRYEVGPGRRWIRIGLGHEVTEHVYLVAPDLLVGVRRAALTDIVLLNVDVE